MRVSRLENCALVQKILANHSKLFIFSASLKAIDRKFDDIGP